MKLTYLWPSLLSALLVVACSGSDSSSPTPARGTTTPLPDAGANARPTPPPRVEPLAPVAFERAFPALSFVRATGLYELPDGSNRFLVLEQRGRILIFDNRPEVQQAALFMDIVDRVNSQGNEEGLLGLAFAPDFARTGVFYLNYTAQSPRRTVIARYAAAADRSRADPASQDVVLQIEQPYANHNGGQIVFGPDGYLYVGMGDGGLANDPGNRAQDLNELLGKMLRIDVSGTSPGLGYRIPPDNPFTGRADRRGEIWAYGLRNPWRFSFDPANGDLWAGDVGQNAFEEIDLVRKGANYGWAILEANRCVRGSNCDRSGTVPPVIDYPTSGGNCSVTGGYVYRKGDIPQIQGAYVYADYCSGRVWALRYDGSQVTEHTQVADVSFRISSFAVDRAGNLYAVGHGEAPGGAGIYRVVSP